MPASLCSAFLSEISKGEIDKPQALLLRLLADRARSRASDQVLSQAKNTLIEGTTRRTAPTAMRLICGLFQLDDSAVEMAKVAAMAEQMSSKFCRNTGREPVLRLWQGGPVAMGLLDFSREPDADSRIPTRDGQTLVADHRIDEYRLAGAKVETAERRPESKSSSSSLLSEGMPVAEDDKLLAFLSPDPVTRTEGAWGDFAFALWNQASERLVCGRDLFGIRPFAYVHVPGSFFAFASFPEALYRSGIVAERIDRQALARRTALVVRADDSLHGAIKRLPPAHTLEVSRAGLTLRPYWQPKLKLVGRSKASPQQAADEVRRLMEQAVIDRLPQRSVVGAHLSGGLDSSSLVVMAVRKLREQGRSLYAYSFLDRKPEDPRLAASVGEDETEYVKAVLAQEPGIEWEAVLPPSMLEFKAPLDADTMQSCGTEDPEFVVCRSAAQHGVERMISGWGGDECITFNGRGALAEMFLAGHGIRFLREARALARTRKRTLRSVFWHEIVVWLRDRAVSKLRPKVQRVDGFLLSLLAPDLRPALSAESSIQMVPSARENRLRLLLHGHIAERAENWAKVGAQFGMDFVFPMLDRRVIEYGLSMPSEMFLRGGFRRRLYRDAMVGVLPEMVRQRHEKYQPFPSLLLGFDTRCLETLKRFAEYEQCEAVQASFDLKRMRSVLKDYLASGHTGLTRVWPEGAKLVMRVAQATEYVYQQSCKALTE